MTICRSPLLKIPHNFLMQHDPEVLEAIRKSLFRNFRPSIPGELNEQVLKLISGEVSVEDMVS